MDNIKQDVNKMKDDLEKGMKKAGHVIKNTAEDLKNDAKGAMATMEMKKDEMMENYEQKNSQKKLKNKWKEK
ncbi:hypothetical protein [Asaccharospora irregularis]|uniref:Uncharacterized protein n=1 Tax=Asaccharospora irregularis DSM 2635 TaxID=1121321 RepID=A0A1M5KMH3_9FIRM|nr:hypothetical protein [Asaccharospora irregularis]SHG53945.1 hypothetical protein SAMN04488530_10338 [Asaccharospora irregularis DSM 2635]